MVITISIIAAFLLGFVVGIGATVLLIDCDCSKKIDKRNSRDAICKYRSNNDKGIKQEIYAK